MFLRHDDKIGDDLAGVARQLPADQTAESTGYEYSGFWIMIPGKHFHLVLAVSLNPGWGSFTVRALSCPQPSYLLSLELVDLVHLVPLLVKAICMLSGLQPSFASLCLSRDCQSQVLSLSPLILALESLQNSSDDGWIIDNSKGYIHCAFSLPICLCFHKILFRSCAGDPNNKGLQQNGENRGKKRSQLYAVKESRQDGSAGKAPASEPDDVNSLPKLHVTVGERADSSKLFSDAHMCVLTYIQTDR